MTRTIERILLVEDLPESRRWLAEMLKQAFPEARRDVVSGMEEAINRLRTTQPDLALIDLKLPDGSGVQLIRHIHKQADRCQCVISTIFDDDSHLFPALHAGAQGYLLKDQPEQDQIMALKGILAGCPPLSPSIAMRLLRVFSEPIVNDGAGELSPREEEVLRLIAKGCPLAQVSDALAISTNTAATYVKRIYRKLQISSRAEASIAATRLGLVSPLA